MLSLRRESGDRNKTDAVASARLQSPGYQTRPSRHCTSSQAWLGRRGLSEPWFLPGQIGPWPPTPSGRGSSPLHVWQHPAGHSAGALQTRGHRGQAGASGRPLGVQQTGFGSQGARSHRRWPEPPPSPCGNFTECGLTPHSTPTQPFQLSEPCPLQIGSQKPSKRVNSDLDLP